MENMHIKPFTLMFHFSHSTLSQVANNKCEEVTWPNGQTNPPAGSSVKLYCSTITPTGGMIPADAGCTVDTNAPTYIPTYVPTPAPTDVPTPSDVSSAACRSTPAMSVMLALLGMHGIFHAAA
jgi:hypothetical protein